MVGAGWGALEGLRTVQGQWVRVTACAWWEGAGRRGLPYVW